MRRTEARKSMMEIFFQMEATNDFSQEIWDRFIIDKDIKGQDDYLKALFFGLYNNKEEVDTLIQGVSKWDISRIPKADLAILRVAICELLYLNVPTQVVINEAVELAKIYGIDTSSSYINGMLSSVVEKIDRN